MLKCSNLFNTLDARGAISVTERVGVIQRVRKMAVAVAAGLGRIHSNPQAAELQVARGRSTPASELPSGGR